ncbi:MAG: hypothetical protein JXR86_04575 [Spirochaetales bacterium]|nr:hypothetical protein [Spirochaetales bacterium]
MSFLIPLTLYGWIPFTFFLFKKYPSDTAVLISVIAGVLLMPTSEIDLPLITYSKYSAISISLVLYHLTSDKSGTSGPQMTMYDLPVVIWCFISPMATSLSNGLGFYDGLSSAMENLLTWGVYYWIGRKYFTGEEGIKKISYGILYGSLLYVPLCLYEIRMSPQLSNKIYGFFPHSFLQHIRYGGFRPIVFMQHGLMVSLWMAAGTIIALWLWKTGEIKKMRNIPFFLIVILLYLTTILTKSANAWTYLVLGTASVFLYEKSKNPAFILGFIIVIPVYIITRATGMITIEELAARLATIFDAERIHSLVFRMNQEDLFSIKALLRPLFGWGGWQRGWPLDPTTGRLIEVVDSLWVITLSTNGIIGLTSQFLTILSAPVLIIRSFGRKKTMGFYPVALSLILSFFMIDSLLNAMVNPIYTMCSGALVSYYIYGIKGKRSIPADPVTVQERKLSTI